MKEAIEEFLTAVEAGVPRRDLFIQPNNAARHQLQLDIFNAASAKGLCPVIRTADMTIRMGDAIAKLCIAHPWLSDQLAGLEWHAIHGMEHLDQYVNGEDQKLKLASRIYLYCVNHPDRRSRTNLDGDELCQECANQWARNEGATAMGYGDDDDLP